MSLLFNCPHCHLQFEAEPQMFGVTCACSNCSGLFVIPHPQDPDALAPGASGAQGIGACQNPLPADALERIQAIERESAERVRVLEEELKENRAQLENIAAQAQQWKEQAAQREELERRSIGLSETCRQLTARVAELEDAASSPVPGSADPGETEALESARKRIQELQASLDADRKHMEALRQECETARRELTRTQQDRDARVEDLRKAEEAREQTEARILESRAAHVRLEKDLQKALETAASEQAGRLRDREQMEKAVDRERVAVARSEQLALALDAAKLAPVPARPSESATSPGDASWRTEFSRLEAELDRSKRALGDAEKRAAKAEEQFSEMLVEWESRRRLAEAFPELNGRLEEQKSAIEEWEKREREWSDREADLTDTIHERQKEIEAMRMAIRTLQQSELEQMPVQEKDLGVWGRAMRARWGLPAAALLGMIAGVTITGGWAGKSERLKPGVEGTRMAGGGSTAGKFESSPVGAASMGAGVAPGKGQEVSKTAAPTVPLPRANEDPAASTPVASIKGNMSAEKRDGVEAVTIPAAKNPSAEGPAGTPDGESSLPNQFLGIKFGSGLAENPAVSQWSLDKGIYHRKTHLVGKEVEAALVPDQENRMMKGTYVRICPRNTAELLPFLEWAVNVQEAISAQYGEPTEVQEIKEASDPKEIVERIAADKDRYVAIWKKEAEDAAITLSIGALDERRVAFRLEYYSAALVKTFTDRVAAEKQRAEESEAAKPKPENPIP